MGDDVGMGWEWVGGWMDLGMTWHFMVGMVGMGGWVGGLGRVLCV